jgi:hypothetical protein
MRLIVSKTVLLRNESLVVASGSATCPEMDTRTSSSDRESGGGTVIVAYFLFYFSDLKRHAGWTRKCIKSD